MGLPGVLTGNHTMSQKLLDVFMLGRCAHEFSWPRRSSDGSYYQVCLLCGVEYRYDWHSMRRTGRLLASAASTDGARQEQTTRPLPRRPHRSWRPRERRIGDASAIARVSGPPDRGVRHGR